jgi:hypothetical protein
MKNFLVLCSSLILFLSTFSFSHKAEAATFSDINGSFAKEYIEALGKEGVITGFPDGTYRPNITIKRSDFAKMLALALELPLNENSAKSFTDVPNWAKPYVGALVDAGITSGKKPGYFGAALPITRQEMIIMFVRAMGLEDYAQLLYLQSEFKDEAKISPTAYPYVSFAEHIGFAEGNPNNEFMPSQPGTRAAAAKWIYFFKIKGDQFFENALYVIGANTVDNIEDVQFVNDDAVKVVYTDGTSETIDVVTFLDDMYMRLQYDQFNYWTGFDWADLSEGEKTEIIQFIVECWQADWSDYKLLAAPEVVVEKVKQRLNNYFINHNNNQDILLEKAIWVAIDERLIQAKNNQ